jgi:DNA (cytosine-5)-methyltransferase 1
MRHASLFSGIGGFDYAAKQMGWENVFHCEIDPFCQRVLKHHFPESISYENIIDTAFNIHRGRIDLLSGGFPCQPFSQAGRRKGTADSRYLWPEMLRAIREIKPRYVVGENVRGIVNWDNGMVFEQVCSDLEAEGYEVFPVLLPACGLDAPHRRERIFFVAYCHSFGLSRNNQFPQVNNRGILEGMVEGYEPYALLGGESSTNSNPQRCERWSNENQPKETIWNSGECSTRVGQRSTWADFPTESPLLRGNDGLPFRLDNIPFFEWRRESIKAFGNAVVPQIALEIFKAIELTEKTIYNAV